MKITRNDYFKLVGILALAAHHRDILEGLVRSACEITQEEADGHTTDCIWGQDYSPDELLDLLHIEVVEELPSIPAPARNYIRVGTGRKPPLGTPLAALRTADRGETPIVVVCVSQELPFEWLDANTNQPVTDVSHWALLPKLPESEEGNAD